MHSASRSPGTSDAASLMSARTGVIPRVPMISALVISAPSQCERSISSGPETPGNRYLLPPEKPTTSCGKTGPTMIVRSCSTSARLIRTSTVSRSIPLGELGDPLGVDPADVGERGRVPPLVIEDGCRGIGRFEGAGRVAEMLRERGVAHPRVRSERDEHREPADAAVQGAVDGRQQERQRTAARPVRDEQAHARPVDVEALELVADERADLVIAQHAIGPADAGRGRRGRGGPAHGTVTVAVCGVLSAELPT